MENKVLPKEQGKDRRAGTDCILPAEKKDAEEILALYDSLRGGAADWDEHYPVMDNILFDLEHENLFVMKEADGKIAAVISIDIDEDVDRLECWDPALMPAGELSRLAIRRDRQNQGLSGKMMQYAFSVLKERGNKGVHLLVRDQHVIARKAYTRLHYREVGDCSLFGRHFVCMEREL